MMLMGIDQYGKTYHSLRNHAPIADLKRDHYLHGRVSKMYVDRDNRSLHVGYVIGSLWITLFHVKPFEKELKHDL